MRRKRFIVKLISNGKMDSNKIRRIVEFVTEKDGLKFAEEKMNEYKQKAISALNNYPESEARHALEDLIEFSVQRTK